MNGLGRAMRRNFEEAKARKAEERKEAEKIGDVNMYEDIEAIRKLDQAGVTKDDNVPKEGTSGYERTIGAALLIGGIAVQRVPGVPALFVSSTNPQIQTYIQSLSLADADSMTTGWVGNVLSYANPSLASSITMLHMAMWATWISILIGVVLLAKFYFKK